MGQGISLQQLGKQLKKLKVTPTQVAASAVKQIVQKELTERFGFDFISLGIKLLAFFAIMFVLEKFMQAQLFFGNLTGNQQSGIAAGLFGISGIIINLFIPKDENVTISKKITDNPTITALFSEQGFKGFRFWDLVKLVAILLVIAEFVGYLNSNKNAKKSPFTITIFVSIIAVLSIATLPQMLKSLKKTDFSMEQFR